MTKPELKVLPDGTREWFLNGQLHREDGPAIEYPNGYSAWYLNGQLHREDGPAIEYPNGYSAWWHKGVHYEVNSLEEFQMMIVMKS